MFQKFFYLGEKNSLSYPGVDDLVNIIKCKGRGCLLFKRDLRRFYRQIGIDIGDSSLLGYTFNGYMYFDKVLSMVLKSAAFIAQKVTAAIQYICQILGISIENYLDDLAGADYPIKLGILITKWEEFWIFVVKRNLSKRLVPLRRGWFLSGFCSTLKLWHFWLPKNALKRSNSWLTVG